MDVGCGWASGPGWDLHCGDWRNALSHVGEVDALIVDAPYSERTHGKQRHGRVGGNQHKWLTARGINYGPWTEADVNEFADSWSMRTRGWLVSITDSELYPAWRDALRRHGRTVFAPLPCVQTHMNVRLAGDGPASWTCWAVVSRTTAQHRWGSLDGAYVGKPFDPGENTATASRRSLVPGTKPLWLMRALIRDYTRPGDLVCDPCAGGSTTLLAAVMEGRRAVGAEIDPTHFAIGKRRLERGFTSPLFAETAGRVAVQTSFPEDDDAAP